MKKSGVWMVFAGLSTTIVENVFSEEAARKAAMEKLGVSLKPWLARDWNLRPATDEDLRKYAASADGYRPSQPTAKTAPKPGKKPKQSVQERLL